LSSISDQINNVFLFVADSLRWDYLPDQIASKGTVFKTVAAGGKTVHTFPTLATGLYPQEYGIKSWGDTLPDKIDSIYDVDSLNTGFFNPGPAGDALSTVLGANAVTELTDLDPPFFHIEQEPSPHAPHAGYTNSRKYFDDRVNDLEQMRADYREGIAESISVFKDRLQELEDRALLDETLVIFTSDHGELLGEYGELLHSSPLCPELVYVPTIFIHPTLSEDDFFVDSDTEIIEQVDIARTAFSLLGDPLQGMHGTDILFQERDYQYGHSFAKVAHNGVTFYSANSIWWYDSGYVLADNRRTERFLYPLVYSIKGAHRKYVRRNLLSLMGHYVKSSHTFGRPPIGKPEAKNIVEEFLSNIERRTRVEAELDERAKETLKDLGYRPK